MSNRRSLYFLDRKALNIQLRIADFGTGYSSLSYLYRFLVDILKVDRAFVTRMDKDSKSRKIVQTIVALAHTLGMDVIAEGRGGYGSPTCSPQSLELRVSLGIFLLPAFGSAGSRSLNCSTAPMVR